MLKLIKWIFVTALVLLVLVVATVAVAIKTLDINEFKPQIAEQVKKHTGRDLTLAGDISWSFYPRLGLQLGKSSLSNAAGFASDPPFAQLDEVSIQIGLLPLLKQKIDAKKILIRGAKLNLEKNAKGQDNWSDFAQEESAEKTPAGDSAAKDDKPSDLPFDIHISGIELLDTELSYRDAQGGTSLQINPLNLRTGVIVPGKPVKLTADAQLLQDGMQIGLELAGTVTADPASGQYKIDDLEMSQLLRGEGLPEKGLQLSQSLSLTTNTNSQQLDIPNLSLETLGIKLQGKLSASKFIDSPTFNGSFNTNSFSPRELLQGLGITLPETADKNVLSKAELSFVVEGSDKQATLSNLEAKLDDSTLSGGFSIKDFTSQAMRFDLTIDQFDADRYLPASTTSEASSGSSESPTTPPADDRIELPREMLQKLNLAGTAKVQMLTVKKLRFEDATVTIKAANGKIAVAPLSAKAYSGSAKINASLDVNNSPPAYKADFNLSNVRSEDILETLFGDRYLSGSADFNASINTAADTVSGLQAALNGKFSAEFKDGTIKGSKLSRKINDARNGIRKFEGKSLVSEDITDDTKFSSLTASGTINKGIIKNNDLLLLAPVFQGKGQGTVDLPRKQINYTLSLADDAKKGRNPVFIPLQVKGPFNDLSYRVRLDNLAKQRAKEELDKEKAKLKARLEEEKAARKAELEQKVEEKKAELEQKLDKKKDEFKQKLQDELKNRLKGLF